MISPVTLSHPYIVDDRSVIWGSITDVIRSCSQLPLLCWCYCRYVPFNNSCSSNCSPAPLAVSLAGCGISSGNMVHTDKTSENNSKLGWTLLQLSSSWLDRSSWGRDREPRDSRNISFSPYQDTKCEHTEICSHLCSLWGNLWVKLCWMYQNHLEV